MGGGELKERLSGRLTKRGGLTEKKEGVGKAEFGMRDSRGSGMGKGGGTERGMRERGERSARDGLSEGPKEIHGELRK